MSTLTSDPSVRQAVAKTPVPLMILVVEDEPPLAMLLERVLARHGHVATVVSDGTIALSEFDSAMARGNPYDLVITDLTLPGIGGAEICKEVKRRSSLTAVLVTSGNGQAASSIQEADGHLSKPFSTEELIGAIHGCFR